MSYIPTSLTRVTRSIDAPVTVVEQFEDGFGLSLIHVVGRALAFAAPYRNANPVCSLSLGAAWRS